MIVVCNFAGSSPAALEADSQSRPAIEADRQSLPDLEADTQSLPGPSFGLADDEPDVLEKRKILQSLQALATAKDEEAILLAEEDTIRASLRLAERARARATILRIATQDQLALQKQGLQSRPVQWFRA